MASLALSSLLKAVEIFNQFPDSLLSDESRDIINLLAVIVNVNHLLKNNESTKHTEEDDLRIAASEAENFLQTDMSNKISIRKFIDNLWKGLQMTELLKSLGLVRDPRHLKFPHSESCNLNYGDDMPCNCYTYIYNGNCYDILSNYWKWKESQLGIIRDNFEEGIISQHEISPFDIYTISGGEGMGKKAIENSVYYPVYVWLEVYEGEPVQMLLQRLLESVLDCFPGTDDAYQLSRHNTGIQELCQSIFNLLVQCKFTFSHNRSIEDLCQSIYNLLVQCKFIIVIHNLEYPSIIFNGIKSSFPDKNNGSRVLLTTKRGWELDRPTNELKLIQLLNDEDGKKFDHLIFGGRPCPHELKILRNGILEHCRFSDTIIVMVAKYLSRIGQTTADWLKVKQSIERNLFSYQDRRKSIVLALLEASDDINSIHQDETKTNQIEGSKQVGTSSDGVAYKEYISVGVEESAEQVVSQLVRESTEGWVCAIVGMAGIGKTTLAKRVYDDPLVSVHFDIRAWINVSQSYDRRAVLFQLLKCVNKMTNDYIHKDNDDLGVILYQSLKKQRYLIVMDDVWGDKAWNDLKWYFPKDNKGSRILVTSREENVIVFPKLGPDCKLNPLSIEKSWDMLQKSVFEHEICPPDLVDIGKQIAKNCKGLPLAIVVIAGVLSNIDRAMESWEAVAKSVSAIVMGDQNSSQTIFSLSYEHLPGHLKSCFLYMGAFPRGSEIKVQTLVRLWMAEGFIVQEDVGVEYLNYFINRTLVIAGKRSSNGRLKSCHIHDLLVDFCVQKARTENFQTVVKDFSEKKSNDFDKGRRFSFQFCSFEDAHLSGKLSLACSALFFGVHSKNIGDILLYYFNFKLLHVLDITPLRFDCFPSEQISKLLLLRYLALTATFELPSLVFKLRKLQTLIVNGPWIMSGNTPVLPPDFWRCTNLRHLQLLIATYLLPPETHTHSVQTNSLPFLQELSNVTLASCNQDSFACIPNLIKLVVCETSEDYNGIGLWDSFFKSLMLLTHLQTLKVSCYYGINSRRMPMSFENTFPQNLKELTLRRSYLRWEDMLLLGHLESLRVLKLKNFAFRGANWTTDEGSFQELRYLLIEETDLMVWELQSDDCFPRLEHLVLKSCKELKEIPNEIGGINNLTHIELHSCSESAEQSAKQIQLEQHEVYSHEFNISIRSNGRK